MSAAIRSVFTSGVALAGATVVAISPLGPSVAVQVPRISAAAVALTASDLTAPPIGALPFQVVVNNIANAITLVPILIGSTEQCTACLGPAGGPSVAPPVPFTGWGAVGLAVGVLTSPVALVQTLVTTLNIGQAVGAAGLALQVPIANTLNLLGAPRAVGGFDLPGVLDRAFDAAKATVDAVLNIAAQALVTGPLEVLTGLATGVTQFFGTLAVTGDVIAAFGAGLAPIQTAVTGAVTGLVAEVQKNRTIIGNDLASGPGRPTAPIPTKPLPAVEAASVAAPAAQDEVKAPVEAEKAVARPGQPRAGAAAAASRAPRPAAAGGAKNATAVGKAARDAVGAARAEGGQVGGAVKSAVAAAKRAAGAPA